MRLPGVASCVTTSFVLQSLVQAASALKICDLINGNSSVGTVFVKIDSQQDVTTKLDGCTTIVGDVYISSNYTGTFELPGVTNITGLLTTYGPQVGLNVAVAPALTSISLGDLSYLRGANLDGAKFLQTLLLPKLETIESLSLNQYSPLSLSLPSVTNCSDLILFGNFTSVSMPALRNISSRFLVDTTTHTSASNISIGHPMTIDLSSLIYSPTIDIQGNITSVLFPVLALAGILKIESYGPQIEDISFPLLRNTTSSLHIYGTLSRVSLPSLIGAKYELSIDSIAEGEILLEIDIPKLENATSIYISGVLANFDLPSLTHLDESLVISSYNPKFDCKPFNNLWTRVKTTSTSFFTCTIASTTVSKPKSEMSTKTKLGIGLGAGIPCILIVTCLGLCWSQGKLHRDQLTRFKMQRLAGRT